MHQQRSADGMVPETFPGTLPGRIRYFIIGTNAEEK
jgi:hypothetical protein